MKHVDFKLWVKRYNGSFVIITITAALLFWLVMPPLDTFLQSLGNMLPPHYLFFEAQRSRIEMHPIVYLAASMIYYFISIKFLSVRARKIINIIFTFYLGIQSLSVLLAVIFVPNWGMFK